MPARILSIILLFWISPLPSDLRGEEGRGYVIGPGDLLEISLYPDSSFNRTVTVREDGTIPVPLVGSFPVSGSTPEEASRRLEELLQKGYYNHPQVEIVVKNPVYHRVAVLGAVRSPGYYPFSTGEGIREIFARSGGLEKEASGGLIIFTPQGAVTATRVEILFSPSVTLPPLERGMILYFPSRQGVYVLGEVRTPGMYPFEENLTLLRAITLAGGFSPRAKTHRVLILRERERIEVDSEEVIEQKREDPILKAGDLIVVPERFF